MERKKYEMTQEGLDKILDACKPVPCMGTGVVDEDTYVLDEERKRELEEFAGDCIRNSGGDPDMPNAKNELP